jgi:hypothetical protein
MLIIGRRNAGKTTILEKMTGSEVGAKPEIRDKEGRLVVRASSEADGYRTIIMHNDSPQLSHRTSSRHPQRHHAMVATHAKPGWICTEVQLGL